MLAYCPISTIWTLITDDRLKINKLIKLISSRKSCAEEKLPGLTGPISKIKLSHIRQT